MNDATSAPEVSSDIQNHSPAELINRLADGKLQAFAGTIDLEAEVYLDDVYAQNRSLSEHAAADYHGRFLLELVQNANDAHERGRRNGQIEVALIEDEGDHGTMYVANLGKPFARENVVALSRIGMSSKPPGEAIGNKGLGFRSVSHVCDAPEIYSQAGTSLKQPTFEGFCFTFARSENLQSRIDNATVLRFAQSDLPMFFLPITLHHQPLMARRYAERGFSSVIRLPLRDDESLKAAKDEIEALEDRSAPLLLFLDRLEVLRATIGTIDGAIIKEIVLERREEPVESAKVNTAIVTLSGADWVLFRDEVPEPLMRRAIDEGVAAKQLHSSWQNWSGVGEVALAISLEGEISTPRLYTFLPMGEGATAPFQGHLHGSFFPHSNRKALDAGVALNRLLLKQAATLAASCVHWMADQANGLGRAVLDPRDRARATADLLVWSNPSSLIAAKAPGERLDLAAFFAAEVGRLEKGDFAGASVVPCAMTIGGLLAIGWRPAKTARSSFETSETFNLISVARHGASIESPIHIIWPELGSDRLRRLSEFLRLHAPNAFRDRLAPAECAKIAAKIAGSLRAGRRPANAVWTAFYRDLPSFMKDGPDALAGYAVVLCDDGTVRAGRSGVLERDGTLRRRRRRGEKVEPSLFFPPAPRVGDGTEGQLDQLKVPGPLAKYFAFAANTLPWHGDLRTARELLERGQVSAYDGETVLTRISQVVNAGASVDEAIAGLRWAFAIWHRASRANRPIKIDSSYRLLVPVGDALIPATEAVFSESWPEELLGKRLHALFGAAPPDVVDFATFRGRLLAPTSHRAFGRGRTHLWAEFLRGLGVGTGLRAISLPPMPATRAYEIINFAFMKKLGISESAIGEWKSDMSSFMKEALQLGYTTNYRFSGSLWWLPGQGDHQRFSDDCREIYAGLVVEWLNGVSKDVFYVDLRHEHRASDSSKWSTPVGAFLRSASWMPADDPSESGPIRHHFRPSQVWISGAANDRFPFYLRQVAVSVSKNIERCNPEAISTLRSVAGLRVLNDPGIAVEQACFLAEQYAIGNVRPHYEPQLINLYNATWKAIGDRHAVDPKMVLSPMAEMPLMVRRRGQLAVVCPVRESTPIYVRDSDDELAPSLVASLDGMIVDIKGSDRKKTGLAIEAIFGKTVRRISAIRYDVKIDGVPLEDLTSDMTVLEACPWLRVMLAVAMEGLRGPDAAQLPTDRGVVLAKLGDVCLLTAADVSFEIDGQSIKAPGDRPAYVFRRHTGSNIVVLRGSGAMRWNTLQTCLPAICQAIELTSVANGMRLLAHELAGMGEEINERNADDEVIGRLCRVLQLEEGSQSTVQLLIGERIDARLPWIRATLHYSGGTAALETCDRLTVEYSADSAALLGALSQLIESTGIDSGAVFAACRQAQTIGQFRELLDFEFARFNSSLLASGNVPLTYPAIHAAQLLNHIVDNEISILDALRNGVAARLDRLEPAPEYAQQRDSLRSLTPDPDWLPLYYYVPEEAIATRVTDWLTALGAPLLGKNPHGLSPLNVVRSANLEAINRFASASAPIIRAWWRDDSAGLPEFWREAKAAEQNIRSKLDGAGVVDHKVLREDMLLAWCVQLGLWPVGMAPTLDREVLGIADTDVEAAAKVARREAEERAAKARSVCINGRDVDPEQADWTSISAEIAEKLSNEVRAARLTTPTVMAPTDRRGIRKSGSPKPRDVPTGSDRTPPAKKDMIGRLGELVVYHWLKDRFRNQDIDKAWVSRFAAQQKGKAWSDELGYDFELKHDRRTFLIEVKASQGDRCQFEMGETEVRAARNAARPRSGQRYVIIYVANPATSHATRIDILPNPMSEEADQVLRLLGEGVRYGFQRK